MNRQHPGPELGLVLSQESPLANTEMRLAILAAVAHGLLPGIVAPDVVPARRTAVGTPELPLPPDGGQPLLGGVLVGKRLEEFRQSHDGTCGGAVSARPLQGRHRKARVSLRVVTVG